MTYTVEDIAETLRKELNAPQGSVTIHPLTDNIIVKRGPRGFCISRKFLADWPRERVLHAARERWDAIGNGDTSNPMIKPERELRARHA